MYKIVLFFFNTKRVFNVLFFKHFYPLNVFYFQVCQNL